MLSLRARTAAGIVVVCLVAVASAAARSGAGDAEPFVVGSTLDGKNVLPHRIHWLGRPSLPASQVSEVEFLIDGKVRWSERNPPYTYGDDGNWLVTSWLSPGRHRFTVRAKAMGGRTAERTLLARVLPAPSPPADLAGTWKRTVTQEQAGAGTPAGTWILTIDKVGWKIRDPVGTANLIDVAYLTASRLQARGGIWTKIPRSGHEDEGNGWCQDTNVPVDYRWAVSASTLTLKLSGADRCGAADSKQHFIWAGFWTKAG